MNKNIKKTEVNDKKGNGNKPYVTPQATTPILDDSKLVEYQKTKK